MRLPEALRQQAKACRSLGSPFMDRLLTLLADDMPRHGALFEKAETWPDDLGPAAASLPLRLAGGLHALVLMEADAGLLAAYPPNSVTDEAFKTAVMSALIDHQAFLLNWIDRPPQTNEVRRSAPLIAAVHVIAAQFRLPFVVSELGASGGLNLMFDRYAVKPGIHDVLGPDRPALLFTPDWRGSAPPPANVSVAARRGVDLTPLDVYEPNDRLRLLAYLWPDQLGRRRMTEAAIGTFDAEIDQDDAISWLAQRLAQPHNGHVHLIYHTVAWQYFPKDRQEEGTRLIEAAGAHATANAPIAWFAMEADDNGRGAGLTLRLWPGDMTLNLGRSDFHGRWVEWALH